MYQHVLAPPDGSELAECVLPHVKAIATGCNVVRVTLLEVVVPLHLRDGLEARIHPEDRERLEKHATDNARDYLAKIQARLKKEGVDAQTEVLNGIAVDKIIEYAEKNGVDLFIIATHGRSGVSRWVWGSTTDRILRSACIPILMVRAPGCGPGV